MVAALNGAGLRVVADVVYNHTFASGPHTPYSVLDKIVPGYYHRRNADGDIEASTCMNSAPPPPPPARRRGCAARQRAGARRHGVRACDGRAADR